MLLSKKVSHISKTFCPENNIRVQAFLDAFGSNEF
jgi:hypothetical protein